MKIFITEIENSDFDEFLELAESKLSLERLKKVENIKDITKKVSSAAAELLLCFAAEDYLFEKTSVDNIINARQRSGVTLRPVSWRKLTGGYLGLPYTITEGNNGKPFFEEEGSPYFNISHTDNITVVVVSNRPVGIDIEGRKNPSEAMLKKAFSQSDTDWILSASSSDEKDDRFLRAWTLKEAYLKMQGVGIFSGKNIENMFENGEISESLQKNNNIIVEKYDKYVITVIKQK